MNIIFFDFETGGVQPHHPNIQLAAVAIELPGFRELGSFERKLQFDEADCDPEALKINHYTREGWKDAVTEGTALAEFCSFLRRFADIENVSKRSGKPYKTVRLAGHNASRFDHDRLLAACERYSLFLPADYRVLDTLQLALWSHLGSGRKGDYKLGTLCAEIGIDTESAHDALADVRLSAKLAQGLMPLGK